MICMWCNQKMTQYNGHHECKECKQIYDEVLDEYFEKEKCK